MQADLFCRVVDNFGDIGVSWRIARQLHQEHGWQVRLWVDDFSAFQRIEPGLNLHLRQQYLRGVQIMAWGSEPPVQQPHPVVIAAFSCELPDAWIHAMHLAGSAWINLEYLSAEDWVEDCHGLSSHRPDGLKPYFFFPGFTEKTGGLPRESDLITRRQAWANDPERTRQFLSAIGLSPDLIRRWQYGRNKLETSQSHVSQADIDIAWPARLVSLFCYPHAPYQALIDTLSQDKRFSVLLVPEGVCPGIVVGRYGNVQVVRIPFLSQDRYDQLLWTCDLNFVRGEDSFMRATWAAKPFVWQLYPQRENTHLTKLDAWLAKTNLPVGVQDCHRAWNHPLHPLDVATALEKALTCHAYQEWESHSVSLSHRLSAIPDLATSIATFCRQSIIQADKLK